MGYYSDYYRAVVVGIAALTPNMIRITLDGEDLRRFVSSGDPDERLLALVPPPGKSRAAEPIRQPDGTLDYGEDDDEPRLRSYTVRRYDPATGQMLIDFVRHAGGVAGSWAVRAEVGDVVYLSPAKGWYAPPAGAAWQLLMADMTALPALGRIVEELTADRRAIAVAEVIEPRDRQQIASPAEVSWRWLAGGNGHGPSRLLAALRELTMPEGRGYVWFAGEAGESRAVRKHLRHELGWSDDDFTVIGYWRSSKEQWMARYQRVGEELEQTYLDAIASGMPQPEALDAYEDALEQAGL